MNRLARTSSWLLLEKLVKIIATLVTSVWVARHLGPETFGDLAFALAFALIFADVSALGLRALLQRTLLHEPQGANETLGTAFILRIIAGLGSGLIAVLTAWLLPVTTPTTLLMIAILATTFVFRSTEVFEQSFLAQQNPRPTVMARVTASMATLGATAAFVLLDRNVLWFVAARAAEFLVMNVGFTLAYVRQAGSLPLEYSRSRAGALLNESWPLILSGLGAILNLKVDQVMLAQWSTRENVGWYAAAAQLSEAWYFIPTILMTAAFPQLVQTKLADGAAYQRNLQRAFDAMAWLGILVATLLTVSAGAVIDLIYGAPFAPAASVLVLHVWGGVFIAMRAPLSKWIVAERLTYVSLVTHGLGAIINIVINALLIPENGAMGAAVATVISYSVSAYGALWILPATRPVALMMSLALLAPLRLARQFLRRGSS